MPPGLEPLWDGKQQYRLGASLHEAYRVFAVHVTLAAGDLVKDVVAECKAALPVHIGPYLFRNRRGDCYIKDDGSVNGFDSIGARFMDRVIAETDVKDHWQERGLRAKYTTDAESLEHAQALLDHATADMTKRGYRRKASAVNPGRGI